MIQHGPTPAVLPSYHGAADIETAYGTLRVWADLQVSGGRDVTGFADVQQQLAPPFSWAGTIDLRLGGETLPIERQDVVMHLPGGRDSAVRIGSMTLRAGEPAEWQLIGREEPPFAELDQRADRPNG